MKKLQLKKNKYRLEGGGRLTTILNIENDIIKWICELSRYVIGITTREIINKPNELNQN